VVTDGTYEVKASEIDRAASRKHLERRLGPLGEYRARLAFSALDKHVADVGRTSAEHPAAEAQQRTQAASPAPAAVATPTPTPGRTGSADRTACRGGSVAHTAARCPVSESRALADEGSRDAPEAGTRG
jgi:hypothetical protein